MGLSQCVPQGFAARGYINVRNQVLLRGHDRPNTPAGRSVFDDLSVSGRPPTSSEAAGPLEKKINKHCF